MVRPAFKQCELDPVQFFDIAALGVNTQMEFGMLVVCAMFMVIMVVIFMVRVVFITMSVMIRVFMVFMLMTVTVFMMFMVVVIMFILLSETGRFEFELDNRTVGVRCKAKPVTRLQRGLGLFQRGGLGFVTRRMLKAHQVRTRALQVEFDLIPINR